MIDAETRRIFLLDEGIQIERHVRVIDRSFVFTDSKGKEISKKMKIDDKLIEHVISELVGEEAYPIIAYLKGKKQISEFIIAEELDLEIHLTRNLLYRLLEFNIVSFLRKKDRIKGWYICYWDFNENMVPYLAEKLRLAKIARLKDRLEKESKNSFYICKNACTRMTFEKSMEFNFKCAECGEVMHEQDNSKTKDFLATQIKELEKKELY